MIPLGSKPTLFFIFFAVFLVSLANATVIKVLKVVVDDREVLFFEVPVSNITLTFKHSHLTTEVREVYEVRLDRICIREVVWPVGGAGTPASLEDLKHLNGVVEVRGGNYVVTDVKYCMERNFTVNTEFMMDWRLTVNGYEIKDGGEVELSVVEVTGIQYLLTKLELAIKSLLFL